MRVHHEALQHTAEQDKNESLTVERGLQARALEVEEEFNSCVCYPFCSPQITDICTSKLDAAEDEIAQLRLSLSRYTKTNNPLPPPPQPLPLDRFPLPLLTRHYSVDSTSSPDHPPAAPTPFGPRKRTESENAIRVLPLLDGTSHPNAYTSNGNSNGSAHTHAMYIPNGGAQPDLNGKVNGKAGRDQPSSARETEHPRSRKISKTAAIRPQPTSSAKHKHSTPSQDVVSQYRTTPPANADADPRVARRTQQPEQITVKSRVSVPDPEPTKRVYPPRELVPSYLRDTSDGMGRSVYGSYDSDEEVDEVTRRLNLARAHVAGYGQGLNEAHGHANSVAYPPTRGGYTNGTSSDRYAASTRDTTSSIRYTTPSNDRYTASTRDTTSFVREPAYPSTYNAQRNPGVTMSVEPAATFHDIGTTPRQVHGRLDSSHSAPSWVVMPPSTGRSVSERVTQPPAQSASPTSYIIPTQNTLPDARGTHSARSSMNSSLEFNSSWGERSAHDSIGSLSSLGMPNTVSHGGVRGQGAVAMTSPMFPRELDSDSERDEPRPLPQSRLPIVETPTHQYHGPSHTSSHTPRRPRLQGYMSDDERIRYPRSTSSSFSQHQSPLAHDSYRQYPADDLRVQVGRRQSLNQSASLDSGTPPPLVSHRAQAQTLGDNALALTFQNSPPGSFFHGRRQSPEQIRAPAPRVGGPTVLTTMWR